MAEQGKGGGFLKEEFAGIPGWIWLAGAGVVVVGYLYLRRQSSSQNQQQSSQQGKQPAAQVGLIPFTSTTTITEHLHKHPKKGKTKNTQSNPSGPIMAG